MVAYPEGGNTGGLSATTTADVSKTTVAGLPMLPGGARFDTSIIPLSADQFLVVQDGGGSSFTSELTATVAPIGAVVDSSALSSALQAESAAYANQ
jgi:sarcosine oxidase gamma subunit